MIRKTIIAIALVATVLSHPGYVAYPNQYLLNVAPQQVTLNPTDIRDFWASVQYLPADLPQTYNNLTNSNTQTNSNVDNCSWCQSDGYQEVCGNDGETYQNVCYALCNGTTIDTLQACTSTFPTGCDNCKVNGFDPVCVNGTDSFPNSCITDCLGLASTAGCCCATAGCCNSEILNRAVVLGWF